MRLSSGWLSCGDFDHQALCLLLARLPLLKLLGSVYLAAVVPLLD